MDSLLGFCPIQPNKTIATLVVALLFHSLSFAQTRSKYDLHFSKLPVNWDEAVPLGNANLGVLVWQKAEKLRFSLDRADLWDQRPMKGIERKEMTYQWVFEQVKKNNYKQVQEYFDEPYEREPAPSKIPAAALEFAVNSWGTPVFVHLYIKDGLCEVRWKNGVRLKTYVHATRPVGWFRFENLPSSTVPELIVPKYQKDKNETADVPKDDLSRLGYEQGVVTKTRNSIVYDQEGWGGFKYQVAVAWKAQGKTLEGVWSITSNYNLAQIKVLAKNIVARELTNQTFDKGLVAHKKWWQDYWKSSIVTIPDTVLARQYSMEIYKFGCVARADAPPISLQAIWTADNGRMPPWKGDFHHDLNTQLSYWPCYSGNKLNLGLGYFTHLQENMPNYQHYTKHYFGVDGLAVPGVTTLDGTEMGGWIQYSFSPTVSGWLAHHFYLHWRYSMDKVFLKKQAYPWFKQTAKLFENLTHKDANGYRQLPISSSPEINNNDITAWFRENTNYDLAIMRFTFAKAAELAIELNLNDEAEHWQKILSEFSYYALSENQELKFAPTLPYNESHRHFSHLMAVHPLSEIRWENGENDQKIIKNTIALLDKIGPDWWCGYSYSWEANLKARAKDGEGAAEALNTFATSFCSTNSFHVNGDQTKSGKSKFTYRPFTLEGNFAYAAGIQEMLLQSYAGFIEVFPAIPANWKNVSFEKLRAEGAFLVSARKVNGVVDEIKVFSEKGGKTKLKLPFNSHTIKAKKGCSFSVKDGFLMIDAKAGGFVVLKNTKK